MTDEGQIERQSSSYKQGIVLGLTMAEIMLLLVFCLLIAAGATLRHERAARSKAEAQVSALAAASPVNQAIAGIAMKDPEFANALTAGGPEPESKISEFWTTLVASRNFVRNLESQGLSTTEAGENVPFLSGVMEMRRSGVDLETLKRNAQIAEAVRQVQKANGLAPDDLRGLIDAIEKGLRAATQAPKGSDPGGHKWPPMISLSEADGYFFDVGSAQLKPEFEHRLTEVVVPRLLQLAREYDVDVIEVVGHTDEQPIGTRPSNLDRELAGVMRGDRMVGTLRPGDNAGLGIARSVSVVRQLLKDERLGGMRILPLSGAQLIRTDQSLTNGTDDLGDVRERRRIEIRLRKSG